MKLHELNAYAMGAIAGYTTGTEENPYDPETRPVDHRLYRYGYDFGVALYCQGEEEGESA